MTQRPKDHTDQAQLKRLFEEVIAPLFAAPAAGEFPTNLPRQAAEALDAIGDLAVTGADLLGLIGPRERSVLPLEARDRIAKRGRTIVFDLAGSRVTSPPGIGVPVELAGPFELELRTGAERFSSPEVHARFQKALAELPRVPPPDLLAAAVLPQRKGLFGVSTPVRARLAGIPISLAFVVIVVERGAPRLFLVGPVVKEIALKPKSR